jgi:hypothetical protein
MFVWNAPPGLRRPRDRRFGFWSGFPGGENAKGKSLRDFAFESKISQRFCFINFVRCLRGVLEFSKIFTDFHRFSPVFNRAFSDPSGEIFTGLHRFSPDPKKPFAGWRESKLGSHTRAIIAFIGMGFVKSVSAGRVRPRYFSPSERCLQSPQRGLVGGRGW